MHESTVWKPIPGFGSFYDVSVDGTVRSWYRSPRYRTRSLEPRLLRPRPDKDGYPCVNLRFDGRRRQVPVHVLVAESFIGSRPHGMEVRHLDGDKLNAHVSNLRYGTSLENSQDADLHGSTLRGENHPQSKLTAEQVLQIRSSIEEPVVLAARFGVSRAAVHHVRNGKTWKSVPL